MPAHQACKAEIEDLHAFFEAWLAGRAESDDFGRCEGVLGPDFELVVPSGDVLGRARLLAGVRAEKGGRGSEFRISTRAVRSRALSDELRLVVYEEHQHLSGGRTNQRLSSAIFRSRDDTPHGVEWLHVHETWIP
jgi:hypothetical protein